MKKAMKSAIMFALTAILLLAPVSAGSAAMAPVSLGSARYITSVSGGAGIEPAAYLASSAQSADVTVSDYNSFITSIVKLYVARDTEFKIRYNGIDFSGASGIMSGAHIWDDIFSCDLPDTKADLDYLHFNMRGTMKVSGWSYGTYAVFEFTQGFYTTAEQEAYVDKTIASVLDSLNLQNSTQASKVRAIHDYIVSTVEYDDTLSKFSAYDALYSKYTVCNGYTLLMYRMLAEAGVPVRAVSGVGIDGGSRENHAWNIVKIGSYWYNIDATWNDSARTDRYFLKNNAAFSDHIRDADYATAAFNAAYPMSPANFDASRDETVLSADTPSSWAKDAIAALSLRSVIPPVLLKDYRKSIARDEFTALLVNVYEYARGRYNLAGTPPFADIAGSPYGAQISKAYELGIISGTGATTFAPGGTLTREQCAKIISNTAGLINGSPVSSAAVLPFGDNASIKSWAVPYVRYA